MPWCIIVVFVANTALFHLSCDVSIFPSILPSLFLLCVIAGHVTPSHLRTVVASPRVYYYSDQIIEIGFCEWNVLCCPFSYIFFCRVFLIRASFSYRMRIQNEIVYRKHWVRTPCPWQSTSNRNEVLDASIRANNPSWSLFSFPHVHLIVLDLLSMHLASSRAARTKHFCGIGDSYLAYTVPMYLLSVVLCSLTFALFHLLLPPALNCSLLCRVLGLLEPCRCLCSLCP